MNTRDIEIVAELDPIRDVLPRILDASERSTRKQGRAVSDLFVRIGEIALVVEAKFFTHPSASYIADQLKSQKEAIEKVLGGTRYASCTFHYLALTVRRLDGARWPVEYHHQTWCQTIKVMESAFGSNSSPDVTYALAKLKDAVDRSIEESNTASKEKGRVKSIQELLEKARVLLADGYQYIGFVGGISALENTTVEDMESRSHYKYSDENPNENWLSLHLVISHYLKMKRKRHN